MCGLWTKHFLHDRITSAWSAVSQFLLSLTRCDSEVNSLLLSTGRYLHATLARVGTRTLLTSQYCSLCETLCSLRDRSLIVQCKLLQLCPVMLMPAHLRFHQIHCLDCCWPGGCVVFSQEVRAGHDPPACPLLQAASAAQVSASLWHLQQWWCWRKNEFYTHTHTQSHTRSHRDKHSHTHTQSHTHTRTHTQTHTHTVTHPQSQRQTQSHTHTVTRRHTHAHTHAHLGSSLLCWKSARHSDCWYDVCGHGIWRANSSY